MQGTEGSTRDLHDEVVRQRMHRDRHAPIYPYLEDAERREREKSPPDDVQ